LKVYTFLRKRRSGVRQGEEIISKLREKRRDVGKKLLLSNNEWRENSATMKVVNK